MLAAAIAAFAPACVGRAARSTWSSFDQALLYVEDAWFNKLDAAISIHLRLDAEEVTALAPRSHGARPAVHAANAR